MNEYLVAQLKKGRLDKGLKQSDVTKETGIKNTTLSNYENGVTEPDMDTFLTLCELYELDFVSLMEEAYGLKVTGKDFSVKPSEIEMIKKFRKLNETGQELVTSTLDKIYDMQYPPQIPRQMVLFDRNGNAVPPMLNAAHADDYAGAPEELKKLEEDIMDDENF